jgi:hypothetical protein
VEHLILTQDAIVPAAAPGPRFAAVFWENPMTRAPVLPEPSGKGDTRGGRGGRTVLFSGWFGDDDEPAEPRRGRFPRSHRTWSPAAWAQLSALCDALVPELRSRGATACFRPHARHILADPQSCLAFLRKRENQPLEVLLEPAAFLTPEMLPRAEDHLSRAFEALGSSPRTAALLLTNIAPAEGTGDAFQVTPLTGGHIDPALLVQLARRHAAHLPWILMDDDLDAQRALISPPPPPVH